jgi:tight adherence protein C
LDAQTLIISFVLFLAVAVGFSVLGTRLWVKPKEALDRLSGAGGQAAEEVPAHPSLIFRSLLDRLGTVLPASPKDVSVIQRRLIRAGIRSPGALRLLLGSKIALGIGLPLLAAPFLLNAEAAGSNRILILLGAAALGFFGPNEYVSMLGKMRQKRIRRALPNALDLMVICVESGLGLDQAIMQVAKELEEAHRDISEEFAMVNLELKAGKRRVDALRNLADRTSVDDLKKLVAVLVQADRFGTGVAPSLRAHADFMRVQARQVAEEKAAKLGVKLVFPIFFCILPSLFVVTVGPVAVRIVRDLIPMMLNV